MAKLKLAQRVRIIRGNVCFYATVREIRAGAVATLERIREVALATQEQSAASTAIAQQVETIAQMVEETSASTQQTAESAHDLDLVARELGSLVKRFRHTEGEPH